MNASAVADALSLPVSISDPVNSAILAVSEDRLQGFQPDPLEEISRLSQVPVPVVVERLRAMLEAGTIRRIRQTLLATNLAQGALVAWEVPEDKLGAAFDFMYEQDPFSGHVVVRTTDPGTPGARYRLWTTLKVPQGFSLEKHAQFLADKTGAEGFRLLPAHCLFVLGVGHVRRQGLTIGSKADKLADVQNTDIVTLSDTDWRVLTALKREFTADEIIPDLWLARAREAGVGRDTFFQVARSLSRRGVIGRFSTFLEHVKPNAEGRRVTRYNALFHWAVPSGREMDAGREVGRFHIMTHAYWREGGSEFRDVNIMGVAHGLDKDVLLEHKAAIDAHLESVGIPVGYTNVFWGGRSEIKPSEVSPIAYKAFLAAHGLDETALRS